MVISGEVDQKSTLGFEANVCEMQVSSDVKHDTEMDEIYSVKSG